jgi:AraC-like DNA-binding protein/mannose-6-phosphate isomerase-like protein (cupin superfamily)
MPDSPSRAGIDRADVAAFEVAGGRVEVFRTLYRAMTFPRHSHDSYTLGVVLRGVGSIWCGGASHAPRRGDIVLIPPGEVHTGGLGPRSDVLSYFAAHVPAPLFERCAEAEGIAADALEFRAPVVRDERVARPLLALNRLLLSEHGTLASLVTRSPGETMAGVTPQEALVLAIATVVRHHGGRRSNGAMHTDSAIVRVAKEVIHSRYADSDMTSLDSLAATVGVTSFHLVRTFTRSIGMSPHQYLLQVRVERARALLASGAPPSLAAARVGFADQSHLSAHFKRYVGTTPGHYQRCIRE